METIYIKVANGNIDVPKRRTRKIKEIRKEANRILRDYTHKEICELINLLNTAVRQTEVK